MEKNCIILDIEQKLQNDLKIALLCMGLKVLIQGSISRSKFVDPFKTFFKLKITCKYTFNVNLSWNTYKF